MISVHPLIDANSQFQTAVSLKRLHRNPCVGNCNTWICDGMKWVEYGLFRRVHSTNPLHVLAVPLV